MRKIDKNYYELTIDELLSDTNISCECGNNVGINHYSEKDRLELSIQDEIDGVCTIVIICTECGEEITIQYRLHEYAYTAHFEQHDLKAVGTVKAVDMPSAELIVMDMCGTWTDEDGNNFESGMPTDVDCLYCAE
jgi:hypothetical protein